ncbi:Holliday junction branch migration DNA helicase RuvB [Enterococcus gallinarum]|uniref:Holliday junction branch migration complex subunit RuvB n=1 Tax=Enterococcus gallinarum TaxID=1353 RepID=A0AAE7MSA0_ENTGA|nr:Holliday junction branch migration DNA helicase RuvB [Enterococcus gallinarum]MBM6740620.1 Holliday junction branch migration DNA helicase RuvB [Enterococcus gallinarum]MDT2679715.1 Holliday junction branch migration DNA helicase RuvB [Enterococcus gallinarum]QOG28678.1 Holliday junction branch migration DNA helicase RuvB [Enterococcus gallinarum]RBT44526.1 Holliday junction ATP-dependent DNA helicase RuvB [Enterococcus gallinarum]ROY76408.1 Holliday junction branch migration DNA helicase R
MTDERIVSPETNETEELIEKSLRPQFLAQYIGQNKVKEELSIYIQAAKNREEALDHVLLYGPPGLGKTTMAMVIANEMAVNIKTTSGPAIEKPGDLIAILNELQPGDVLFIDEIHRLPRVAEEMLYSAMEDFFVDIMVGQGTTAHPVHFPLPPFTLVGATTRAGMLSAPLRDRFGIISHMEYYEDQDLKEIVLRSADIFQTEIVEDGAFEIARRSRGTPRIANRLLKRVRDFAQVQANGIIDRQIADKALLLLQVDHAGLDYVDQKLIRTMIELYGGGPVGLSTLSVNIGEETETVEDMYEPYLIQRGFLKRTPRGRIATTLAYTHFGYENHFEEL